MKKLISFICVLGFCSSASAQSIRVYSRPLSFFVNSLDLGIEKKVSKKSTFGVMLGYGSSEEDLINLTEMQEFKFEVNLKYFLRKMDQKHTYYIEPFLMFKNRTEKDNYYNFPGHVPREYSASAINVGFLAAKRFNWNNVFMDLQVGGGIMNPIGTDREDRAYISNILTPYSKGVTPRFGLNVGIKF